jgi:preprotein translocase subunit SecA
MNYSIEKIRGLSKKPLSELLDGSGNNPDYAFAACCNACENGIGLTPFDEQIQAGAALYGGKVIEMKTGEGKTIAAVIAAFLQTLDGRSVHILTYNDYLVKRDYNWMKPMYDLLGVDVAYITESSAKTERQKAYSAQVVYNTAKECGFDFLRDFVADKPEDVLHKKFDVVIVDEADSILIDEARIPLVIAGSVPVKEDAEHEKAFLFVKTLNEKHYGISDEEESAYLTERGIEEAESNFGVDLFDDESRSLLSDINDCLKACFVLKENVDYIVKESEILLIDEFTGRAAKNRRYPDGVQAAVEIKHGIKVKTRGVVMGTVPLQYFVRQYEHLSGMTGTVFPSEEEFELLYALKPEKIQPHTPSQRIDRPMEIYSNQEAKRLAIKQEIIRAHEKGQPVLVGAESIEESESLAEELRAEGIEAVVLNAKNDEAEAEIIKNAGALGTVTISANMAGRGVDILLGGFEQKTRDEVVKAGGLYVISTSMRESSRINLQLRGRTGRQGDVGESKVFTALDDDIMVKYELKKLVPKSRWREQEAVSVIDGNAVKITDKVILREAERLQRISEGDRLDERKRLLKFSMISEKHRDAIFKARRKFTTGEAEPSFWQDNSPGDYEAAVGKFGEAVVNSLQRELILSVINEAWSDYLVYTSALREGIHLTRVGGKSPVDEFNIDSQRYYESMEAQVVEEMADGLERLLTLEKAGDFTVKKPESVYTYLQNESADELVKKPLMLQAVEGSRLLGEDEEEDVGDAHPGVQSQKKKSFWGKLFS